ncbi:MAG TPA: hypothetical protein VK786_00835 [bacterium]|jgi:hypothetical protein|nr:hypothetical protein [bacterium]
MSAESRKSILVLAGEGALFLSSAPLFYRLGGWLPILLYAALFYGVLVRGKISLHFRSTTIVCAVFLAALSVFLVLHSHERRLLEQGRNSDRGDALFKATRAMLDGDNPYAQRTVLGNPITPMPGALVLAVPFVCLGEHLGFQTVLWLTVFFMLLGGGFGSAAQNRGLLVLALSPVVFQDLAQSGDYIANALYVFVFVVCAVRARGAWGPWVWGALLGIAMASRPSYWIVPALFFPAMEEAHGRAKAALMTALAAAIAAALNLYFVAVFYPGNVAGFPPLHVFDKLALAPRTSVALLALALPLLLFGLRKLRLHQDRIIDACAKFSVILCALVLGGFVMQIVAGPDPAGFNRVFYLTQASCVWPFALIVACLGV